MVYKRCRRQGAVADKKVNIDESKKVLEELSDVAEVEKDIPLEGRRMSMILNAK